MWSRLFGANAKAEAPTIAKKGKVSDAAPDVESQPIIGEDSNANRFIRF